VVPNRLALNLQRGIAKAGSFSNVPAK